MSVLQLFHGVWREQLIKRKRKYNILHEHRFLGI